MSSSKVKKQTDSLKAKDMRLKLYEQALRSFPNPIVIVDRNYIYRAVNPSCVKRHHKPEEEVVGRRVAEIMGQQVFDEILKPCLDRCLAGETVNHQIWVTYPDLGRRYMDVSYCPIPGERSSVEHVAVIIRDITEQESTERALKESEQRYRTLIEGAKDIIYSLDPKTGIINSCNDFAEETLGYRREDMWGKMHFLALIHPDDRERLTKQFRRALSGGERQVNYPFRLRKADGSYIDVEQNATILRDASGEPYDCIGVVRDVTGRKRMEEAVRLSEQRHHQILDTTLDYIVIMGTNAEVLYANKAWHDNVTYTLEELSGPQVFETIHPDDREEVLRQFRNVLAGAPARNMEYRSIRKNGEIRWLEANANPIQWPGVETAVLAVARDVTDRKRIEEELRLSEERSHRILDSSHDMIVVADQNAKVLFANKAYRAGTGYTVDETNDVGLFHMVHPEDREETLRLFRGALKGTPVRNFECRRIDKDGRVKWVESNVDPIHWPGAEKALLAVSRDVTERKRMEAALRESEERYRNMFCEAPDIFYVLDLDTWVISDANRYALEALEYGPEDLGKVRVSEIIHPDDYERAANRLSEMVIKRDRQPNFPLRILTRTGRVRHIEQSGVIFWDENGRAKSFLGLAHDVTKHKEQEEAIQRQNERLRVLYDFAHTVNQTLSLETVLALAMDTVPRVTDSDAAAMYLYDENTQTLNYCAHRGFSEEFIRGTDGMKAGEGLHGHVAETRQPLILEDILKHPLLARRAHTKILDFRNVLIVPLIAKNKLGGTFTIVRREGNPYGKDDLDLMTGLANQIAVAMENANLYAEVSRREKNLQSIFETSRDGIALFFDHRMIYRNKALLETFGYTEEDDLTDINPLDYFSPEALPVLQWVRSKLDAREEIDELIQFKGRKKDGTTFDAEARAGFFYEGDKRYVVVIGRDVTERNRMEFQLRHSSKLAALGELAAGVAHEINNPVATIDIQSGLMREILDEERKKLGDALFERLDKYLRITEDQVQKCQSVTNHLLSFSRTPESREETFDINELLKRTVGLVVRLADEKPEVEMILDERRPLFRGDPNRLEQVFVNLLNNALKATDGGGSIAVITRLDDDGSICVEFKDSGHGIPDEIRHRIFDPFFTTRPEGEGTGLGLSICFYIVKEMNGKLDVESSPAQGTTFTVTLPGHAEAVGSAGHGC